MSVARLICAALLLMVAAPAVAANTQAPDVFERGCGDDDGNDRCDAAVQRKMRESYGLADMETLAAQGVTLRRAMFVDGYGNDVVAITFSRAPGRSPMVEIATPRIAGATAPQSLSAAIDQETWQRVIGSSRDFDKKLAREAGRDDAGDKGGMAICLHGWFVVVEAADAARLQPNVVAQSMEPAKIRRDAESSCTDGLAEPYAFSLADIAWDSLPECASLKSDDARNKAALLALCHRLRGDRVAAGEAYQFIQKLTSSDRLPEGNPLRWLFAESAGELAEPFRTLTDGGRFYLGAPNATDVDHAVVEGEIAFWGRGESKDEVAEIKLMLVRQTGDFVIQSYQISARKPLPADE